MQVQEIMSTNVEILAPTATLMEAAQKMKSSDVGMLPVCNGEKIEGVITDRDIVVTAVAQGQDIKSASVESFIQREPKWVYADADVEEAAKIMKQDQIRRLIVVDRNKKLVGVVALGDIATRIDDEDVAAETLEEISQPDKSVQ